MFVETLYYFMEVASGKNYFEISEDYNISQSSISKSISKLEAELNVQLFNHKKRPPVLTEKGEIFYKCLLELKPQYEEMLRKVQEPARHLTINIDIFPNIDLLEIDTYLQDYQISLNNQSYSIKLNEQPVVEICIDRLKSGVTDFIVTHRSYVYDNMFSSESLKSDSFKVILPKNHPLAKNDILTLNDIYEETIFIPGAADWCAIDEITKRAGVPLPQNLIVKHPPLSMQQLLSRVNANKGILLSFASKYRHFNTDSFVIKELRDIPAFPIVIYKRKDDEQSLAQKLASDVIKDYFKSIR